MHYTVTGQKSDTITVLIEHGRAMLRANNYSEASKIFSNADQLSTNSPVSKKIIISHNLAESYRHIGQYNSAIKYYNKAYEYAKNNIDRMVAAEIGISICYKYLGDYPIAIEHGLKALKISTDSKSDKLIAKSVSTLASIYMKREEYDEAHKNYLRAELLFRKINDNKNLAKNLNNHGIAYNSKKEYKQALHCFRESLKIKKKNKNKNIASNYNNIGDSYKFLEMPDSAIYFYKKSIEIKKKLNNKRVLAYGYNNLAEIYLKLDSVQQAFQSIEQAGIISKEFKNKGLLKNYYLNKKNYFVRTQQMDSALLYFEKFHNTYAELLNTENTTVIAEMREIHKSDQLKKEGKLKDSLLRNKQSSISALIIVIVLIGISLILAIHSYILKRKAHLLESEAREEVELAHLKIKTVMNEMSHRIKNNLQLLISMMNIQTRQLSDLEARKITQENRNRISAMAIIHKKLYTQHDATHFNMAYYLENLCNNIRHSYGMESKVRIHYKIDNQLDIDVNKAILLGLIANEILSNSFKYAFAKKEDGALEVSFQQNDSLYILYIADNGIGFKEEEEKTTSFGLTLVKQLCQQLKGTFHYKNPNQGAGFYIEVPKN